MTLLIERSYHDINPNFPLIHDSFLNRRTRKRGQQSPSHPVRPGIQSTFTLPPASRDTQVLSSDVARLAQQESLSSPSLLLLSTRRVGVRVAGDVWRIEERSEMERNGATAMEADHVPDNVPPTAPAPPLSEFLLNIEDFTPTVSRALFSHEPLTKVLAPDP